MDNYVDGGPTKPIHTYEEALRVAKQFHNMTDRLSAKREVEIVNWLGGKMGKLRQTLSDGWIIAGELLTELDAVRKERDARLDIDALTEGALAAISRRQLRAALHDAVNAQVKGGGM